MAGWATAPKLTQKHTLPGREVPNRGSLGRLNNRFIHQQDGDAVADGVNSPALSALQALAFVLQDQAFLAHRADQNFQQLWRDHGALILLLRGQRRFPMWTKSAPLSQIEDSC